VEKSTFTRLYAAFKKRLVQLRKRAGLTQRQLAARLGRERSFVSRIEVGERRLDLIEFYWVARACNENPAKEALRLMHELQDLEKQESKAKRGRKR